MHPPYHRPIVICLLFAAGLLTSLAGAVGLDARPLDEGPAPQSLRRMSSLDLATVGQPSVLPAVLPPAEPLLPAPNPAELDPEAIRTWVDEVIASTPNQDDPYAIIDGCMAEDMAGNPDDPSDDTPGASLAISIDGELAYAKGYGVRQSGEDTAVDPETRFRIGSTTKQLTAAALMQLVDAGQVDVDAPITDYLPDLRLAPPYDAADITPHHLMTHSTGIPDQYWVLSPEISLEQWLPIAQQYQLHAPPGSFWNYANPNFTLAGIMVQRLSGKPYYDYMAEEVFARAAMTRTTFYSEAVEASGNYATGHDSGALVDLAAWDLPAIAPAGTAFSTPSDMIRWAELLTNGGGEVLSPESAAAMQAAQMPIEIFGWDHYGYGIMVTDMRDLEDAEQIIRVYDHGGNIPGYSSQLFWVPERGFAISILANTIRSLSSAAYCSLQVLAQVRPRSAGGLVTGPEDWGLHEGTYAMGNTAQWPFTAQISVVSDTMRMDYSDLGRSPIVGRDYPMIHALADTFLVDSDNDGRPDPILAFTFIRDRESGERIEYLRDRLLVGHRIGQFPDRVVIEGQACADIDLTAERDMPALEVSATGLSNWGSETGLEIGQDDPADPSSASFRRDIRIDGGADLFFLAIAGQPGDTIASYLMLDADGDGDFSFPAEAAVAGVAQAANLQLMFATQALPPGDYQLWVQGVAVADPDNATFDILPLTTQGDHLSLEDAPESLSDGQQHSLKVCADGVDGLDAPALGSVTFRYGQPPRVVRVMVDWSPAALPPSIYLPQLYADWMEPAE